MTADRIIKISAGGRTQTVEMLRGQVVLIRAFILSFRQTITENMDLWMDLARAGFDHGSFSFGVTDYSHLRRLQEILAASMIAGRIQIRNTAKAQGVEFREIFPKDKPPAKAIDWIKALSNTTREQWEATVAHYRNPAFFITGIEQQGVVDTIKRAVAESLEKGWTLKKFEEEIRAQINDLSLTGGRLRNVWHNNVTNAFNKGREAEIQRPEVKAVLSYYLFDAIVDGVVRDNHKLLEGGIAPVDWPDWERYKPMLGYNCRCSRIAITAGRAQRMLEDGTGWDMTQGVPAGAGPDPGYVRM